MPTLLRNNDKSCGEAASAGFSGRPVDGGLRSRRISISLAPPWSAKHVHARYRTLRPPLCATPPEFPPGLAKSALRETGSRNPSGNEDDASAGDDRGQPTTQDTQHHGIQGGIRQGGRGGQGVRPVHQRRAAGALRLVQAGQRRRREHRCARPRSSSDPRSPFPRADQTRP